MVRNRLVGIVVIVALAGASGVPQPASASAEAGTGAVSVERDVNYAPDLTLDLHRLAGPGTPLPAVIVIHGGAFSEGLDRSVMDELSSRIAAAGYVVANISYRLLAPEGGVNRWPAQLEDAQAALGWLRENAAELGVLPDRICAVGHSSGGQLAALLGLRDGSGVGGRASPGVACVVSLGGVSDPTAFFADGFLPEQFDPRPPTLDLLAGSPDEVPEAYRDASPLAWVSEGAAPFLILHGTSDAMLPVSQSRRMAEALRDAGVEVVFDDFAGS
jgi:acetyl esterase/lipase